MEMRRIATLETGIAAASFTRRSATAAMFRATDLPSCVRSARRK
jgi:hypothetical protein